MKKAIIISIIIFFQIISIGSFAQSLTDQWRLIKISEVYSRHSPQATEFIYDDAGKLKMIKYYHNNKKWDGSAVKDFVYNTEGLITSYKQYGGRDTVQSVFSYDDQNRLISSKQITYNWKKETKHEKRKVVTNSKKFSYKGNEIKESRLLAYPGGDRIIDETTYTLDENGNIIGNVKNDLLSQTTEKYISGEFDNKPSPMLFTGAYFNTEIQSKQNGKQGHLETWRAPESTKSIYDANGMLKKKLIIEKDEYYTTTSEYTYTYAKIKSLAKPVIK